MNGLRDCPRASSSKSSWTAKGKEASPVMLQTWHVPFSHLLYLGKCYLPTLIYLGCSCINPDYQPRKLCHQRHVAEFHGHYFLCTQIELLDALLKNPVALKVLVWSKGRLVTL